MPDFDYTQELVSHLKGLGDEALLDYWEQSQAFEHSMSFFSSGPAQGPLDSPGQGATANLLVILEMMEMALMDEARGLKVFALPVGTTSGGMTGRGWNAGTGREGLVLHELQLRFAFRAL